MKSLPIDPGEYDGTYKLVGGQSSLDLINTISWPGRVKQHDWLDRIGNVRTWAVAVGLLQRTRLEALGDDLGTVHRIRSLIAEVLMPHIRAERPTAAAMDAFNRALGRAAARRLVAADTMNWSYAEPTTWEQALAPVVVNAAEVLTSVNPQRLGNCPACDWVFHDTTRNARRRWCDMADCGSRDKARRYYHRTREA